MSVNADKLVQIVPRVIDTGTPGLAFNGLLLTQSDLPPLGQVLPFSSAQAVAAYFGDTSTEAALATQYFAGYVNADYLPSLIYFAPYSTDAVGAWLRGGAYEGTLAQLQAVTDGSLTISIDGAEKSLTGLDFSGDSSFSAVAQTIQTALDGGTVAYSSQTGAFQITSPTTGETSSVSYGTDGTTGTGVASLLNLTQTGGAVQSLGQEASTPAQIMTAITGVQRNWVSFTTTWEPELDEKMALAQWQAGYDTRFAYFEWDTDPAAKTPNSTASFAAQVKELGLDGVVCHYNTAALAAAHMGLWASVNWDSQNGDIDPAFKSFEGLAITCDNDTDYDALIANGYNVYADFATASAQFKFFQNAQASGKWDWVDQYMCAIAIKDGLQLNILDLFALVKTLPYTESGYAQVRTACLDTIEKFKRFGAIRAGVTLSQTQKVALLAEIGSDVSRTIETQGWYMQVKDPGATVRGQRGTPDCRFYYTDGGSIHQIIMPSTLIQ